MKPASAGCAVGIRQVPPATKPNGRSIAILQPYCFEKSKPLVAQQSQKSNGNQHDRTWLGSSARRRGVLEKEYVVVEVVVRSAVLEPGDVPRIADRDCRTGQLPGDHVIRTGRVYRSIVAWKRRPEFLVFGAYRAVTTRCCALDSKTESAWSDRCKDRKPGGEVIGAGHAVWFRCRCVSG